MKKSYIAIILISLILFSCNSGMQTAKIVTADKNSTKETNELFLKIKEISKTGFMVGHEDSPAYGIGWKADGKKFDSDFYRVAGDFPSVFGWDIGNIEARGHFNIDTVDYDFMRETMIKVSELGAINTVSWHLLNPVTGETSWSTTETIKYIFSDTEILVKYDGWIKKLADFFLSLENSDGTLVPVIFRPYHEHDGSWFWWGEDHCTPEEYIKLWRYTFDKFNELGVHNLLYSYSPNNFTTKEEYLNKYPGDDYVDILGFDLYYRGNNEAYTPIIKDNFNILRALAVEKNKIFAFTETGYESIPDDNWYTEVVYPLMKESGAAWVLFWRNRDPDHHYVPYPGHNAAADFKKFCNYPDVLLLGDMK